MAVVTGFTAARMLAIEMASVISGKVEGNNLVLYRRDGTPIDAGNVRGPRGEQGVPGDITVSPAGGALSGNYPNPSIAARVITDASVSENNIDGAATTPSMRTLGDGPLQAAAGDHDHDDTGWVDCNPQPGEAPLAGRAVIHLQYRKRGPLVHVRLLKVLTGNVDRSTNQTGNFVNVMVVGNGSIPEIACPSYTSVVGQARCADTPVGVVLNPNGAVIWHGGFPRNYTVGQQMQCDFVYYTDN